LNKDHSDFEAAMIAGITLWITTMNSDNLSYGDSNTLNIRTTFMYKEY